MQTKKIAQPPQSSQPAALRRFVPIKGVMQGAKTLGRFLRNPAAPIRHRAALADIVRNTALAGILNEKTGYGFIPKGSVPSVDKVVEYCNDLLRERRDRPELWPVPVHKRKDYPLAILSPKERKEAPPIFDLVLSNEIIQIASEYLGEIPVLQHIKVWWTPHNQDMRGSQFYHRDSLSWSERQAKFLINLTDVDDDAGPFTFLPADISDKIVKKFGYPPERVSDETVFETASPSDQVAVVGPPGTMCAVDSSRCFHFGSRCRGNERLILMFHFRPVLSPDRIKKIPTVSKEFAEELESDSVRRLIYPVACSS